MAPNTRETIWASDSDRLVFDIAACDANASVGSAFGSNEANSPALNRGRIANRSRGGKGCGFNARGPIGSGFSNATAFGGNGCGFNARGPRRSDLIREAMAKAFMGVSDRRRSVKGGGFSRGSPPRCSFSPVGDGTTRRLARFALVFLVVTTGCSTQLQRQGRLDDFDTLCAHLAAAYANLDECASRDGIDLVALHRTTRDRIEAAHTNGEARRALEDFLAVFRDPHLKLDRRSAETTNADEGASSFDPGDDPDDALEQLGYTVGDFDRGPDFTTFEGFVPLADDRAFPAGILTLDEKTTLGLLRIPDFRPTVYRDVAVAAYPSYRKAHPGAWDEETGWYLEDHVANELLRRLASRVRDLLARGATHLVVDLTRNGGGTSWCDPAARVLSPLDLAPPRVAFTRHPHWSAYFKAEIQHIDSALTRDDLSSATRSWLRNERARIAVCLEESLVVPDRSRIFRDAVGSVPPLLYRGDAIREAAQPRAVAHELGDTQFEFEVGVWQDSTTLFVLMDDDTASASEYFVAMLRDNHAATLLGGRTLGAGQGYTRGGVPLRLPHFECVVRLPDSSRLRQDDRPELDGIEPDVSCDFDPNDSRVERAEKTIAVLRRILAPSP